MRRFLISIGIVAFLAAVVSAVWIWHRPILDFSTGVLHPEPTVRFAVVGDNHGTGPIYQQIIKEIKTQPYAFLLNLADTSDDGTAAEFTAVKTLESQLPFPVIHVLGSHDIKAADSYTTWPTIFGSQPCSSQTIGPLHIILLDNAERKVGFPAACLDWLKTDLADHASDPTIVAYHRPFDLPLASFLGDDETAASRVSNTKFLAILDQHPPLEVFTAHLHTYLPYALGTIPAVVSGGGGANAQVVLGGPKSNFFHYLDVTLRGRTLTIRVVPVTLTATTE